MNTLAKSDIFFFVTTIAVVVISLLLAILIIYIIKISSDVKYISGKAKNQADLISEDLANLRENIKDRGFKLRYLFDFFNKLRKKRNNK